MKMFRFITALLVCLAAAPAWGATGLGDFPTGATVYCPWTTNAQDGHAITRSTNGTISVYKENNTTQSTTGVTDTEDFDANTGSHLVAIDTSADGTFYAAGKEFWVLLTGSTVDTITPVVSVLCTFSLERSGGALALIKARLPNATPGAAGGVFIAGTNAATTITSASGAALTLSGTSSAKALSITTAGADAVSITPTAGSGLVITANGTSKHGVDISGGTGGTSDGMKLSAGTGGVALRATTGITVDACTGCSSAGGLTLEDNIGIVKNTVSNLITVTIRDSATQQGRTGIANTEPGLSIVSCRYDQGNADCTALTPAAMTRGTWTSSGATNAGIVAKDDTGAPGLVEFSVPNAVVAEGADRVDLYFKCSSCLPTKKTIELVDFGLTNVIDTLGTPTGASLAADIASVKTDTGAIKTKTDSMVFTGSNLNAHTKATESSLTYNRVGDTTGNLSGSVGSVTGAVGSVTGNVGGSVASVGAGGITASTFGAGAIDAAAIAANAIGASEIADNAITNAKLAAGAISNGTLAAGTIDSTKLSSDTITAATVAADVAVELAQRPAGSFRKNVASQRRMPLYLADSTTPKNPVTGATVTVRVTKDGGVEGAATGTVAEIGSGLYMFIPSQADTNCDTCVYRASATGALDWKWTIYTTD